jgi:hypothetical protein
MDHIAKPLRAHYNPFLRGTRASRPRMLDMRVRDGTDPSDRHRDAIRRSLWPARRPGAVRPTHGGLTLTAIEPRLGMDRS